MGAAEYPAQKACRSEGPGKTCQRPVWIGQPNERVGHVGENAHY